MEDEKFKAYADMARFGTGVMRDGKHVPLQDMIATVPDEPEYIAQTFEREHTSDPRVWFARRMDEARERGLRYPRFTHDNGGLLIEVWRDRWPADQGEPRWQMRCAGD